MLFVGPTGPPLSIPFPFSYPTRPHTNLCRYEHLTLSRRNTRENTCETGEELVQAERCRQKAASEGPEEAASEGPEEEEEARRKQEEEQEEARRRRQAQDNDNNGNDDE